MKRLGQQRMPTQLKAGIGVIVVAALGYGVAASFEHSRHAPAALLPAAAQPAQPAQTFDYFPDHYRNQATEPAEPIATF